MSEDRAPIEQLLDAVLYAPLGVAVELQRRMPDFVREGRQQAEQRVVLARFIGKMVVHVGRQELTKRLAALREPERAPAPLAALPTSVVEAGSRDVADEDAPDVDAGTGRTGRAGPGDSERDAGPSAGAPARPSAADTAAIGDSDPAADEAALPIPGYDSLSASQVVGRLDALTAEELDAVDGYEAAHRKRRTILSKVAQLRAAQGG